jgi:hypothetical protein
MCRKNLFTVSVEFSRCHLTIQCLLRFTVREMSKDSAAGFERKVINRNKSYGRSQEIEIGDEGGKRVEKVI